MIHLRVEETGRAARTMRLDALPAGVGRAEENAVVLDRGHVSSRHGEIFLMEGAPAYADLGSTNGSVLVRGGRNRRLSPGRREAVRLEDGDRLLIGDPRESLTLHVESLDASQDTPPAPATIVVSRRSVDVDEERLERAQGAEPLAALCRFARTATAVQDEEALAAEIASTCTRLFPLASHVTLYLRSEGRGASGAPRTSGDQPEGAPPRVLVFARGVATPEPGPPPSDLTRRVREQGQAILVTDPEVPTSESGPLRAAAIRSMIAAPLCETDRDWDVLQVENRKHEETFSEGDLDLLVLLAAQATRTLARLRRESRLRAEGGRLADVNRYLIEQSDEPSWVGPDIERILEGLGAVVQSDVSVLITGETGTGKEVVARFLHDHGPRREGIFMAVNCAAVADTLLESELFGHERGAFTGAEAPRRGLFELADGSTLFLDEIGDVSLTMQSKLLRVLETGEVRRLGAERTRRVDVRIVAATNKDLRAEVADGRFRADLFYRLAVYPVHLPPLRERRADIVPLALHFATHNARKRGVERLRLSKAAEAQLMAHDWPGNVRELRNEMERVQLRLGGATVVEPHHLSRGAHEAEAPPAGQPAKLDIAGKTFEDLERWIYEEALRMNDGHQSRAAKALGLKYTTFRFRAKKVGVL